MRSILTILTCTLLLTFTMALPMTLTAQPPGHGPGGFSGDFSANHGERSARGGNGQGGLRGPGAFLSGRIAKYLELTDEQIDAAKQIKEDLRAEVEPLHEQARDQHKQLRELLDGDNPDPTTVGQLVIDTHALRDQVRQAGENAKAAFVALLTPAQLEKWEELQNFRDVFGPGKARFGGGSDEAGPRHRGPRHRGFGSRFGG